MRLFHVIRGSDGYNLVPAGIKILCEPADIPSLSRSIPTFINDHYRNPAAIDLMLKFPKSGLGLPNSNVVLFGAQ